MLGKQELTASPFQFSPAARHGLLKNVVWAALLAFLLFSWQGADMRPLDLFDDGAEKIKYASSFFSPDFHLWRNYAAELLETLQMAMWGTALGALFAVPLGCAAASNVVPWWLARPLRACIGAIGAVSEVVLAMLFVVAVGLGPFAGVLALFIATSCALSFQFAQFIEEAGKNSVLRGRPAGMRKLRYVLAENLQGAAQRWKFLTLEQFRFNFRMAMVVGLVGAGGIGVTLWEIIRSYEFERTAAVLLMIVAAIAIVEFLIARVRKILLG